MSTSAIRETLRILHGIPMDDWDEYLSPEEHLTVLAYLASQN